MSKLGQINKLSVTRLTPQACFLDGGERGEIMVVDRINTQALRLGQELEVFVYVDADESMVATTGLPLIVVGEVAALRVVAVTEHGAFLDWGLRSDLFMPRSEQLHTPQEGETLVVTALIDKVNARMIASSRLYQHLAQENDGRFAVGEAVDLLICQETELGFKAVINGQYLGVLFHAELLKRPVVGQSIAGFIKAIRADDKIDLRIGHDLKTTRDLLQNQILEHLTQNGGVSSLTDKSAPEAIYRQYKASKNAYKQAIGALFKQKLIALTKTEIRLL